MPTYDYICRACDHRMELFQSMREPPRKLCPACGKRSLERQIGTGAAIIFKGSGFYQTDYRSESYKKAAEADAPGGTPKDQPPQAGKAGQGTEATGGGTGGTGDAGGAKAEKPASAAAPAAGGPAPRGPASGGPALDAAGEKSRAGGRDPGGTDTRKRGIPMPAGTPTGGRKDAAASRRPAPKPAASARPAKRRKG